MTVGANSYGTAAGVGALVPKWAGTGAFAATTRPTLAQVESWLDQVSAIVNGTLRQEGFAIPVTQADAKLTLTLFVQEEVADIVNGINGAGRFGPTAGSKNGANRSRYQTIVDDVQAYIRGVAVGLDRMGATRTSTIASGICYRDTDEGGDDTFPLFQRGAFGATFTDWDS